MKLYKFFSEKVVAICKNFLEIMQNFFRKSYNNSENISAENSDISGNFPTVKNAIIRKKAVKIENRER